MELFCPWFFKTISQMWNRYQAGDEHTSQPPDFTSPPLIQDLLSVWVSLNLVMANLNWTFESQALSQMAQCENLKVAFLPKITTSVRGTSPFASEGWPENLFFNRNQDCSSSVYTLVSWWLMIVLVLHGFSAWECVLMSNDCKQDLH